MKSYRPGATGAHGLAEELQWARILARGEPARGMALVFIQKLCTAFHEFAPAWERGALDARYLDHFRSRLVGRARRALETLENNGLGHIGGTAELALLLCAAESAQTMQDLADLAERAHAVGHALCDALEQEGEGAQA